jgi:putative ABC transport system permease protein
MFDSMRRTLSGAWRSLRGAPRYAMFSIALLALGIAATTTVFALLKVTLIDPLPYPAQHQLLHLYESKPPEFPRFAVAPGKFPIWQSETRSFSSMAMYTRTISTLTGRREAARIESVRATADFFTTIGAAIHLGRTFNAADASTHDALVVLSHQTWQNAFAADPEIVGKIVTLDNQASTVLGVLAPAFDYPNPSIEAYTLWRLTPEELQVMGGHFAQVVARLKPEKTAAMAAAELDTISKRLEREFPEDSRGWGVEAVTLVEDSVGAIRPQLYLLFAGVALLLLIACANVASLTLVRVSGRLHEFAVRRAQGASSRHVAWQLIAEGMLLSVCAGLIGAALAATALHMIQAAAPASMPRVDALVFTPALFGVAMAISFLVGVLASVVPAMLAVRRSVSDDIRHAGRAVTAGFGRGRAVLIIAEIAIAVVLLSGAGLLARSLFALTRIDPGFDVTAGLHAEITLPDARYSAAQSADFFARMTDRIAALPGVQKAAFTQNLPMVSDYWVQIERAGRPAPTRDEEPTSMYYAVTPDYLATLGIRLLRGRSFTDADRAGAPGVLMVSAGFAEKYFPGEDVIGKRIRQVGGEDAPWLEIVGVVADVHHYGLDRQPPPGLYEPLAQSPFSSAHLAIKTQLPPATLAASIKAILGELDRDVPLSNLYTTASMVNNALVERRFFTGLIVGFAASALLLATVGLYGTLAYLVSQRAREIGVRLALGAQRGDVLRWVLRYGLHIAAAGAVVGLILALLSGRVLEGMVFGITARDPWTLISIALGMMMVAAIAAIAPALRAMRIEPMTVLRGD